MLAIRSMPSLRTLQLSNITSLDPEMLLGDQRTEVSNNLEKITLRGRVTYEHISLARLRRMGMAPAPSKITCAEIYGHSCWYLNLLLRLLHEFPSPPTYFPCLKSLKVSYDEQEEDVMWDFIKRSAKTLETLEFRHMGEYNKYEHPVVTYHTPGKPVFSDWTMPVYYYYYTRCLSDFVALRNLKFRTGTGNSPRPREIIDLILNVLDSTTPACGLLSLEVNLDVMSLQPGVTSTLADPDVESCWKRLEQMLLGPHFPNLRSVKITIMVGRFYRELTRHRNRFSPAVSLEDNGGIAERTVPSLLACPRIDTSFIVTVHNLCI
ncbi:unnamed protein product [Cyclocybe aegerita]|uniref:Uncharacterized protein n=1 Tax=Cyclocybe aegerita TaxID=1973307 RepID=A0A8S0VRP5_CYCAE|nr:unnamed protein product [Cyclocybe aegerita]